MNKWKKVKLREVCEQINGVSYKPDDVSETLLEHYIPVLRAHNIQDDGLNADKLVYVREEIVNPRQIIINDDIIICASSGSKNLVGKAAQSNKSSRVSFGAFCKAIRPKNINGKYLGHFFQTPKYRQIISGLSAGANINNLRKEDIASLEIPLPPLEEQKRIADILDKASSLIDLRKQQLEKMDLLIKSKFIDMFGDPVTNPKRWEVKQLADFADIIMGQSPSGEAYNENGIGMPLLNGPTEFGEKYPSEKQWTSIITKTCHKGDILFCVRGATAGRMNFADKEYCIGRGLAAIRGNKKNFNEFIYVVLKNMYEIFQNTSNGSTFININKEQLASVPIFVTTDKLQDQYLHFVEQVEKQKAVMQQSLEKMEMNYKALMQEYFG